MAEREIKIGLASYRSADAPEDTIVWAFGLFGAKVDVHESDLGRFDRLNAPSAASVVPLPAAVADEPSEEDDEQVKPARRPRSAK